MNPGRKLISAVMSRNVCQVGIARTAMDALTEMHHQSVSSVLVVDNDLILGIITESDIVRTLRAKRALKALGCVEVMQSPVITVRAETGCLDAYHLMAGRGIRHLAVADEAGHVLGIVSEGDMMRNFGVEYYANFKEVGSAMSTDFCKLPPSALVADALAAMADWHQSCVVVVDKQNHAVGILTERDVVRLCTQDDKLDQLTLYEAMRAPVITVRPKKALHLAVKTMEEAGIRRLVVTEEGGVVCGLLTHHEVARGLEGDYVTYLREIVELQAHTVSQAARAMDETQLLADILRSMNQTAVLASDPDFRISYATPSVAQVLGLRMEEVGGADIRETLQRAGWHGATEAINAQAASKGGALYIASMDGAKIDIEVSALLGEQQQARGYLVLAHKVAGTGH